MAVNWLDSWLKSKWVHHGLRLAFAILVTTLLFPFKLDLIEYTSYDLRMQLSPRPKPSGQVVLLPVDQSTLRKLKRDPEALDWAVVLQKLAQAGPSEVVTFINPTQIQGSYDDLAMLSEIMGRMPFFFGEDDLPKTGQPRMSSLPAPFETVPVEATPATKDRKGVAKDGVTRREILSYEGRFLLFPRLAQNYNGIDAVTGYSGNFQYLESTQVLIRYRDKGAYPTVRFIDVLDGKFNPADLRGKTVLIGNDTMENSADYLTTPMSKDLLAMSKLEMYANAMDTLILNQAPRLTPDWVKVIFTFLISLLTIYIVLYVRPGQGLVLLGVTMGTYILFSLIMFAGLRWMVPVAHPLVAVFICYYFVIPYRLIIENRRSWEYYQKNKLLTQVEELKSNFMRMMSHDLKTPLARIQGMADVIRGEQSTLSETQRVALDTISQSSDELTEFIGSILSLSRIESKDMKLDLRSRDVNQLLRDVLRKLQYLAAKKNIEIHTEFEPLFSFRVDEDLLKTVFMNLVENAIKYSPENSKILLSTEELEGEVIIQVADQGRGIPAEDMQHIFDRFYRARNSRVNTAGNGLGLFLAKYFVELHNGRIEVESMLDKGSTFTVRLPMEFDPEIFETQEQPGGLYV